MEEVQNVELAATVERLSQAVETLDARLAAMQPGAGQVDHMVATVEAVSAAQFEAMEARLAEAERQIAAMTAQISASCAQASSAPATQAGRRTLGVPAASLLAKHGVGESGPVDASVLDAALGSLPVEQRIAVKSQLLRAGLVS
jgi:hypothetical protein